MNLRTIPQLACIYIDDRIRVRQYTCTQKRDQNSISNNVPSEIKRNVNFKFVCTFLCPVGSTMVSENERFCSIMYVTYMEYIDHVSVHISSIYCGCEFEMLCFVYK